MESERAAAAAKAAEARRALGRRVVDDAERLVADWNARQEGHMPMLLSPTNRHRRGRGLLVPLGTVPGVPQDAID